MALNDSDPFETDDIALIGMGLRYPGAETVEQYWANLRDGVESIDHFSRDTLEQRGVPARQLDDPHYVRCGRTLEKMEWFDAEFFGLSPKEAAIMDPQHRKFLECCWEALEDSTHPPSLFDGSVGVFAGCGMGSYFFEHLLGNPELMQSVGRFLLRHTGNDKDFLATRVSYCFDLSGPSINVQTACSTSLVAVHLACQHLLNGECDMALAGGVTIELPHRVGYRYQPGEILSPDGRCRAFDASSQGTVFGSGAGVVVLRRLADALADGDRIYAVMKGTAVNNDGAQKAGYLAPSVEQQAAAAAEAIAVAGISARSIGYVAAHGTGTRLGDPIEIAALTEAFRQSSDRTGYCAIGSVKPNVGHLDTAAGIASLMAAALAIHHGQIPPSLNFSAPNPQIDFANSPFFVPDQLSLWPGNLEPRRAAVNSLGVGGTNAHVILQQAPPRPIDTTTQSSQPKLLMLSARSTAALDAASDALADHLRTSSEARLEDVAFTLRVGRHAFDHRRIVAVASRDEAIEWLGSRDPRRVKTLVRRSDVTPSLIFLLPGGGSQYPGMAADLYRSQPVFRKSIDDGAERLLDLGGDDPRDLLFFQSSRGGHSSERQSHQLQRPAFQLPIIFLWEMALAQLWDSWGVRPDSLIGHSMGENTAACLSGVMSFDDALGLVLLRGQLMERVEPGGMLSVPLGAQDVTAWLTEHSQRCSRQDCPFYDNNGEQAGMPSVANSSQHELVRRSVSDLGLDLATINSPEWCVVSGPQQLIDQFADCLQHQAIDTKRIPIRIAAHSRLLQPILDPFRDYLRSIPLSAPQLPFVSNRTGTWIRDEEATDPEYWVEHLRHTVQFSAGVQTLQASHPHAVWLEVGPGKTLGSLVKQHLPYAENACVASSLRHAQEATPDSIYWLTTAGQMAATGVPVDESKLVDKRARRISLPTYRFQSHRFWIEPSASRATSAVEAPAIHKLTDTDQWFSQPVWHPRRLPRFDDSSSRRWLLFVDAIGIGEAMVSQLRRAGHDVIVVRVGDRRHRSDRDDFTIVPEHGRAEFEWLFDQLHQEQQLPDQIVHLWLVTNSVAARPGSTFFERNQEYGIYSLTYLAQVWQELSAGPSSRLTVVTSGAQSVRGEQLCHPEKATALGPVMVVPQELPGWQCCAIDLPAEPIPISTAASNRQALDGPGQFADQILALAADQSAYEEKTLAIRDGLAWFPCWERASTALSAENRRCPSRNEQGDVFLVTGGLGGIALEVVARLAVHSTVDAPRRFALVSRSSLPSRDQWEDWLRNHTESDPTRHKICKLREIEEAGAEVQWYQADVADARAMREVQNAVCHKWGNVNHVVHAAGTIDDRLIAAKTRQSIEHVLRAKVYGTLLLDELFDSPALQSFTLFSSTSTLLGPAGQTDYVAANCFLNAFAVHRNARAASHGRTTAVNWGVWRDVGIGAGVYVHRTHANVEPPAECRRSDHPLIDELWCDAAGQPVGARTVLNLDRDWIVDEHRDPEGRAIVPGTGYLELLAGLARHCSNARRLDQNGWSLQLEHVEFVSPCDLEQQMSCELFVFLKRPSHDADSDQSQHELASIPFTIESVLRPRPESVTGQDRSQINQRRLHVQGRFAWVRKTDREDPPAQLADIPGPSCADRDPSVNLVTRQGQLLRFGPRWDVYKSITYGQNEAIALLQLPERFHRDLDCFLLHPALLDMATGFGLPLVPGYDNERASLYIPAQYDSIRVDGVLSAEIVSRIRLSPDCDNRLDRPSFDVLVTNRSGQVIVDLRGLVMHRLDDSSRLAAPSPTVATGRGNSTTKDAFLETYAAGIQPEEGAAAFERLLARADAPANIMVSSIDPTVLKHQVQSAVETTSTSSADIRFDRPNLGNDYEPPASDLEAALADVWQDMLGVDQIGVGDDFFELGGHSLNAVRFIARVKNDYGVEYPISKLFEAPTISAWAKLLEPHVTQESNGRAESNGDTANGGRCTGEESPYLVPLHVPTSQRDNWRPPLFLVAGMFGNVLNLRHLAVSLGENQPVYGLQARGLLGDDEPHRRFPEMASDYLKAIRHIQPDGPYYLGGFSGGGVVAFEMAQQLLQQGESVGALVMLDTPCVNRPQLSRWDKIQLHWQALRRQGISYFKHWYQRRREWTAQQSQAVKAGDSQVERTVTEFRSQTIRDAFMEAHRHYQTQVYTGDVLLFRPELQCTYALSRGRYVNDEREFRDHYNHWRPYVQGRLDVIEVSGNHDSMVLQPHVRHLATRLREQLDICQRRPAATRPAGVTGKRDQPADVPVSGPATWSDGPTSRRDSEAVVSVFSSDEAD